MSLKHKVNGFAFLIIMLSACSSFSKPNTSTDKIVEKIKKQPSLLLNYQLTDRNIQLVNKLSRRASDEELVKLSGNEDDKVVCLAFLILNKRNHIAVDSIYEVNIEIKEGDRFRLINRINRNYKGHTIYLESVQDFFHDVYKNKKYLDVLKK